jgi:predicted nucleic acid-binding Zn ribbon protein
VRRRAPRPLSLALESLSARLAPLTLLAEVQRAWPDAVGPAVAREAVPEGEHGGTLTVSCTAAVWAQELDLMGPVVIERLNASLGREAVRGLRCRTTTRRR